MPNSHVAVWAIVALSTLGVILRPLKLPEAIWPLAATLALLAFGLLPLGAAFAGVRKGVDVYLFLIGMMLLAEMARHEGLFDWLAARAVIMARGSAVRLFALVYVVGIIVTIFLSNDATAVVLTPAVGAVARTAKVGRPLPFLLICAFIANAASFVLPISNPANLVVYGSRMPPLLEWLPLYAVPSIVSIALTFGMLRWTQRGALRQPLAATVPLPELSLGGKAAAAGIAATAVVLMAASTFGLRLGLPTCVAGLLTLAVVTVLARSSAWRVFRDVSWSVIALVAGLFVLVEALDRTGVIRTLSAVLRVYAQQSQLLTAGGVGLAFGLISNLINNLTAGLMAGNVVATANLSPVVTSAALIGIDLGPNLSVTGSLASILWLSALRRDGVEVKAWDFLKLGVIVMPPALIAALVALLAVGR
jgi:arsenical pump membrane protein